METQGHDLYGCVLAAHRELESVNHTQGRIALLASGSPESSDQQFARGWTAQVTAIAGNVSRTRWQVPVIAIRHSDSLSRFPGFPHRRAYRAGPDSILLVGGQPWIDDTAGSIRLCCVRKILPRFEVLGRIEDKAVNHRDSRPLHWDVMEFTTPCRFPSMLDAGGISGISHRQDHQKPEPRNN